EQKHALYALVDPISPPSQGSVISGRSIRTSDHWLLTTDLLMVEAPGTAPGSDRFITTAVYRHSRLAPAAMNISAQGLRKKTNGRRLQGGGGVTRAGPSAALWGRGATPPPVPPRRPRRGPELLGGEAFWAGVPPP